MDIHMYKNSTFSISETTTKKLERFCSLYLRKKSNVVEKAVIEYIEKEMKLYTKRKKSAV